MHTLLMMSPSGENGLGSLLDVGMSGAFWTPLIFVLSLPFMWKFVFGPICRALESRELDARNAAESAKADRAEVERMKTAIQEDLDAARREAAKQVADAKARAAEREKELLGAAKEEAEKERSRAKAEIDQSLDQAREVLRREAVGLAVDVAEQVIRREFSASDQERLVSDFEQQVSNN